MTVRPRSAARFLGAAPAYPAGPCGVVLSDPPTQGETS